MKPSERKRQLVEELANLHEKLDVGRLYGFPRQKDTQEWLAEVASVFKNLDEGDYQEVVRLSKTITPTESREKRKSAAYEINNFVRRKVAEYKRYDFNAEGNPFPNSKTYPKLMFGEAGKNGQPGAGGSVFIQAEHFNVIGGGKISADGGDYIVKSNVAKGEQSQIKINYGTINEQTAEAIKNLTELMRVIGESQLKEDEKMQLIGNAEIVKASIIQPKPDRGILQRSWEGVQAASTIAGAAQLIQMISTIVLPLLK